MIITCFLSTKSKMFSPSSYEVCQVEDNSLLMCDVGFVFYVMCCVAALMYSVFGVVLWWGRGVEDELNTVVAGTATGLLYKCSGNHAQPHHRGSEWVIISVFIFCLNSWSGLSDSQVIPLIKLTTWFY